MSMIGVFIKSKTDGWTNKIGIIHQKKVISGMLSIAVLSRHSQDGLLAKLLIVSIHMICDIQSFPTHGGFLSQRY